ncbi:MAG: hypothetical protein MI861_19080 [Pirellulales bacterium]|nr:hypothetical protein [Pirellulales bacterium]
MLTTTCVPTISESTALTQNETLPSDIEISRRVLKIRSRWSVGERLRRRREAEQRFFDLMTALSGDAA